ncbi:RNA polymerase sigma factor [Halioglobus maricola]|uniref:RNA polymerase sigma factor n=1 Tax=Halioglobus maricola TaxID=2601894 RepID=A0A5P9NM82_9GAMM|nr:RNA polymerase sigma factor [Halioglobus maricola]QFU76877.1 RNA polymerase sigma factor [Halioglobus maricola]
MDKYFRQWTTAYQTQVWSLARFLLKDSAEAEDVVQEAFIRLWQHRETLSEARVKPWLLRVTRNMCLDRLRRERPEADTAPDDLAGGEEPLEQMERSREGRKLHAAVLGLDEPYRSLVIMRDVQQHSYEDVAATLDLSLPQVKTYLHRARKTLRDQLMELRP